MRVRARVRRRQPEGLDRVRIRVRVKGPRTAPPTRRLESAGGDLWVKRGVSTVVYPATLQPYLRCNPIYAATLSTLLEGLLADQRAGGADVERRAEAAEGLIGAGGRLGVG